MVRVNYFDEVNYLNEWTFFFSFNFIPPFLIPRHNNWLDPSFFFIQFHPTISHTTFDPLLIFFSQLRPLPNSAFPAYRRQDFPTPPSPSWSLLCLPSPHSILFSAAPFQLPISLSFNYSCTLILVSICESPYSWTALRFFLMHRCIHSCATFIHVLHSFTPHILSVPFHSCIVFTHELHSISSPLVHAFFPFMRYSHSYTALIFRWRSSVVWKQVDWVFEQPCQSYTDYRLF